VEVSSEDPAPHPVEEALRIGGRAGWRAGASGPQTLRLRLDEAQRLQRIRVYFEETQHERPQEFVLRWSADGKSFREIVRQQWNFSPSGSTRDLVLGAGGSAPEVGRQNRRNAVVGSVGRS
jgi:hypothetical protein